MVLQSMCATAPTVNALLYKLAVSRGQASDAICTRAADKARPGVARQRMLKTVATSSIEGKNMDQTGTMNPASTGTMSPTTGGSTSTSTGGNGSVTRTVENASATAHSTIDKVSNAARPAVDRLTTSAHQAVDKIADAATTAAESIAVKSEQLKSAHARITEEARIYVRSNPLAAVGVAVAVGFVLSRLFCAR